MTGKLTRRATGRLTALLAAAMAAMAVLAVWANEPAGAATERLPDLAMARLTSIQIESTNGQRLLRFDTTIVNIGAGKFEAHGMRPGTSTSTMGVHQHIFDSAGGQRDRPTGAVMYYSGDGHNHWHVRNLERYALSRLDNGKRVGTDAKEGFCFYDNYRFGASTPAYYEGCANGQPDAVEVKMGLSRGWGDRYEWNVVGQYIDVTGLADGRYRLWATADRANWFKESDETNNSTWADIRIRGEQASVIRYGPSARPIG